MNSLDKQYIELLNIILEYGVDKKDRTGTGTRSIFGYTIRHNMAEGFPLLTTKNMPFKTIVTELLWFLRGDTNIKYLVDNNCHIWDGDAIKKWMSSDKCYKFRRNLYIEPKFEILSVDEVNIEDFPYINSAGYYGFEKDGIEELWVNFSKFDSEGMKKFISDGFIHSLKTDDEFAKKWGELGPIYGKQWRSWCLFEEYEDAFEVDVIEKSEESITFSMGTSGMIYEIDQIQNLINELKTNPDSRRLMVNAWNVGELDQMVLPPCHYGFQVYTVEMTNAERCEYWANRCGKDISYTKNLTDEKLDELFCPKRKVSLMWNQRSVDVPLGLPFNIASYGILLILIGEIVNMVPDQLVGNLGDTHIYLNQLDGVREQITREPYALPTVSINTEFWLTECGECGIGLINADAILSSFNDEHFCKCLLNEDIQLHNYVSHPTIKFPLSN